MKERKPHHKMNTNTKMMTRREQVAISRLHTGYTSATHSAVLDKKLSLECLCCAGNLVIDHIFWHCVETETKRLQTVPTKKICNGGRKQLENLITYVNEKEVFDGI
jgi:hypothetical protein